MANETTSSRDSFKGKAQNDRPVQRTIGVLTDEEYVKTRLDDQLEYFNGKSIESQNKYKQYKRWEFALAASMPVFVTFSTAGPIEKAMIFGVSLSFYLQIMAAIGGVILAFFTKVLELEEYYMKWKDFRVTAEELRQERIKYMTRTEPYDEDDCFPILVGNIEAILNKENKNWQATSKQKAADHSQNRQLEQLASIQKVLQLTDKEILEKIAAENANPAPSRTPAPPSPKKQDPPAPADPPRTTAPAPVAAPPIRQDPGLPMADDGGPQENENQRDPDSFDSPAAAG